MSNNFYGELLGIYVKDDFRAAAIVPRFVSTFNEEQKQTIPAVDDEQHGAYQKFSPFTRPHSAALAEKYSRTDFAFEFTQ